MSTPNTIIPRPGLVLIQHIDTHSLSKSILLKPDSASKESSLALVLAVADNDDFSIGDKVVIQKYSGHELDNDQAIVPVSDVLAVLES